MADDRILEFIDQALEALITNPQGGGGYHAAETQVFRLLELRHIMVKPENPHERANDVRDRYLALLDEEYPGDPGLPLYVRVGYDVKLWTSFLLRFKSQIKLDAIWPPREVTLTLPDDRSHSVIRSIDRRASGTTD